MERNFKGVWIPKEIWESKTLTLQEKVFFVEIDSLDSSERGCYANNHYFSEFFGISKTRVSLVIKSLIDKGFITSTINVKEGHKRILKGSLIKVKGGLKQKLIHSNTVNNTVSNTIKEIVYSKEIHDCLKNCLTSFPETLHPNETQKPKWLDTIDKLHRIDKIPFEVIESITSKVRQDDFWSKNFMSLTKLRKTNKDGVKYIVAFYEQFKNKTNGKQFADFTKSIRESHPEM